MKKSKVDWTTQTISCEACGEPTKACGRYKIAFKGKKEKVTVRTCENGHRGYYRFDEFIRWPAARGRSVSLSRNKTAEEIERLREQIEQKLLPMIVEFSEINDVRPAWVVNKIKSLL